jgi:acetyl esterase/lipase
MSWSRVQVSIMFTVLSICRWARSFLLELYAAPPANPEMSPLLYPSHKGLPPTYIKVCGMDPLRDEGLLYEKMLKKNGIKTKLDM